MPNALTTKLSSFADLADDDRATLDQLGRNARSFKAGHELIHEGSRPEEVFLLVEGWACRYKVLPDGKRQIVAYLIPGDLCDINIFILKTMDHTIKLLGGAKVATIPKDMIKALLLERPAISQALFWATLVDEAVLREWLVNIGQRDAYERTAHLFCELWSRMSQVGLVAGNEFALPLTQEELADTVGLTGVHMNRMLQRMRRDGLIVLADRRLRIPDIDRLRRIAAFEPNYLHLDRRK